MIDICIIVVTFEPHKFTDEHKVKRTKIACITVK